MYYQYFGLREAPFSIAVNPRYLYMSPRHRDALAHLLYGIGEGGGFILLTGEVGTGKTTINRCLLEQLPDATDVAIVLNPALDARELLATVCDELQITYDSGEPSLKELTDRLHAFLLANHARGRNTVLIIDEAQHLNFDVLEQIRLLTNLETDTQKLLQIILIGQPELAELLARPELRQLRQRITARYNLEPLNQAETGAYIRHRLQVAGLPAGTELFGDDVVRGIYRITRGIPRLINVICDRVLLGTYGQNQRRANRRILRQAAAEVMGQEIGAQSGNHRWLAVAASLLLGVGVVAAGAWWWSQQQVESAAVPSANAAPVAESPAAIAAPEEPAAPSAWMLGPEEGEGALLSLALPAGPFVSRCDELAPNGPVCGALQASTWSELMKADRPLLLDLVTPERFAATALLVGLEEGRAWLWQAEQLHSVALSELGPLWNGRFHWVWQPPAHYRRLLSQGDSGPDVASIADLFAQLDGQGEPLSRGQFNAALEQRVKLFQQQFDLEEDGVVGVQTLLRLNEQLGIDRLASDVRLNSPLAATGE